MRPGSWGALGFAGVSLAWMLTAVIWSSRQPSSPASVPEAQLAGAGNAPAVPSTSPQRSLPLVVEPGNNEARAAELATRLVALLHARQPPDDSDEIARIQRELSALGERAVTPLVDYLRREGHAAERDPVLDFLRQLPGALAEQYLIEEARSDHPASSRSIAIDALAERRTDLALQALDDIVATDPDVPSRPFIAEPRQPDDTSTELPDEVSFTPRMKAMLALASTEDPRVIPMLVSVLRHEGDESLRMEAARNLSVLRHDVTVLEALASAAQADPSPYVRLAALHALDGAGDPSLAVVLGGIAARDPDAGVRSLAARILSKFVAG